jgi:predicted RecA/RadA family phage recombinase
MKNFIQHGHYLSVPAPAGGALTGEGLLSGNIFGVVAYSAGPGELLEMALAGVYTLPKATATVLTVGARVAWDNTAKNINVPGAGRYPVGVAIEAVGNGVSSVAVRLDAVATAAQI